MARGIFIRPSCGFDGVAVPGFSKVLGGVIEGGLKWRFSQRVAQLQSHDIQSYSADVPRVCAS